MIRGFIPARRAARFGPKCGRTRSGGGLRQGDAFGRNRLPEPIIEIMPIDQIDPVGQVALCESFAEDCEFVEGQGAPGIHRKIEIGIRPCPAERARAEHPCLGARRQIGPKDLQHDTAVIRRQIDGG